MDEDSAFLSAAEAAALLGVSKSTLYVYVGRKGLRSRATPGSRERQYWKADLLRVKHGEGAVAHPPGELTQESGLTLVAEQGHYYRGVNAIDFSHTASLEEVAALLWKCPAAQVFTPEAPRKPAQFDQWVRLLAEENVVDRALSLFPRLEQADLRAYDLSGAGMARTGADVVRWMTAIVLRQSVAPSRPIHEHVAQSLKLDKAKAGIVRSLLVLAADHGFEPAAYAVRAVASTGVSPWRAVMTGLLVVLSRKSGFGRFESLRQLLSELSDGDAQSLVVRCLREGEPVPGFGSRLYPQGDPRARALLAHCSEVFGDAPMLRNLAVVSTIMQDAKGLQPDFALACLVAGRLLDLPVSDSLFLIGRTVGWVAHAIEQYAVGEFEHAAGLYVGPLPERKARS